MIGKASISKRFLSLAAMLLLGVMCFAQPTQEDSKKQDSKAGTSKLKKYRSSSQSSDRLLKEAEGMKEKDPSSALDNVQQALEESIAQGNSLDEGKSYLLLGDINVRIKEWNLALQNYEKALSIFSSQFPDSEEYIKALTGLARANLETGNYEAALSNYNALVGNSRESKVSLYRDKSSAQLGLSEVYYRMERYDEALKVAEAIEVNPKASPSLEVQKKNQLAKIYARRNELDKTKVYIDNSLNTARALKPSDAQPASTPTGNSIQETKEEVADVLRSQKRYDDEIELRNQSIEYNLENENLGEVTKDKVEISKTLDAKGETSAALKEAIEAAAIADNLENPRDKALAYLSLADLYEKSGQGTNALRAYKKYSIAVEESEVVEVARKEERQRLIRKQEDILSSTNSLYVDVSEDAAQQALIETQRIIIISLTFVVMLVGGTSVVIYRSAQSSKKANQLLALKSLRSQMNPHFIFNALNSVNHFIAQQDERTANRFLSDFSQLMRLVLENSQEDFITLQKEQEILTLYMKLEHYRFRDKFDYEIEIDEAINPEAIKVPPMLIQPYLENAVWHGLRYRDTKGFLKLTMELKDSQLVVRITDDGIGRKKSAELKTENQKKHNSTGLKNIRERLQILNHVYKTHYEVNVSDGADGQGTIVDITIPAHN
jgi:tetratricopeptide (TPR) repeat protein